MALSAFDDKSTPPTEAALRRVLGPAGRYWGELVRHVGAEAASMEEVWNFAGTRYGWSLRLVRKKRVLVYLTPQACHFLVGVVLGEKAVGLARESNPPGPLLELIEAAPRYAEGRGIRLTVATRAELLMARRLATFKMST